MLCTSRDGDRHAPDMLPLLHHATLTAQQTDNLLACISKSRTLLIRHLGTVQRHERYVFKHALSHFPSPQFVSQVTALLRP